ncbi:DUF1771-domain-containing protein [Mycena kentingensis (nom. inval.)]|nr:DUF1771-domain-containing protein [Mycena kentingensis (nom. inval.)]
MFLSTIFFLLLCLFFCRKPPTNRRAEPPTASVRQWRLDDENIPLEAVSHSADTHISFLIFTLSLLYGTKQITNTSKADKLSKGGTFAPPGCIGQKHKGSTRKLARLYMPVCHSQNIVISSSSNLAKNQSRLPNEIDLHGLLAREGKVKVASAVDRAKALGYSEMRVIVGKGNHSNDGLAQLRPKITTYIAE